MIIHEKKYFNKWRQFDCSINIETIKKHEIVLIKRYKLLRDIIMVNISNKVEINGKDTYKCDEINYDDDYDDIDMI